MVRSMEHYQVSQPPDHIKQYRENPMSTPPPPPSASEHTATSTATQDRGITITRYNAEIDLVTLLENYGAKKACDKSSRRYICPFHDDTHASLLVSSDSQQCRCLRTTSDCPLSGHLHDAFTVFCIAEQVMTPQALRRLNDLPDAPQPGACSSPQKQAPSHHQRPQKLPEANKRFDHTTYASALCARAATAACQRRLPPAPGRRL